MSYDLELIHFLQGRCLITVYELLPPLPTLELPQTLISPNDFAVPEPAACPPKRRLTHRSFPGHRSVSEGGQPRRWKPVGRRA